MDLASVVAARASVGVRVSGSTPNSSVQVDSSRACPTGLAVPEPSGTFHDPGHHFQPLRQPRSEQRRPARAHAAGPVLDPHTSTDCTRDTRDPEPWLPAPEDGRLGEGQRLTPGAPRNGGKQPPRGRPSATPTASNAGPQGRTLWGRCWVPTPAPTAPGTHGTRTLAARSRGRAARGGTAPDTGRPSQRWKAPPPGTPFRHPHGEQRRPARAHALWDRCWVPTPAPTAPGTPGTRNPGYPLQRTDGRGRDSA